MIDYEGSWNRHIPLVEFMYNNSFQLSIRMAPYEAHYQKKMQNTIILDRVKQEESD